MTARRFAYIRARRHALWLRREWARTLTEPSTLSYVVWLLIGLSLVSLLGVVVDVAAFAWLWGAGL